MVISYDFKNVKSEYGEIGQNIVFIGTAEKGPYMEPTLITSPEHATKTYGSLWKGNLVKAFNQAYDENRDIPIYLMRIGCQENKFTLQNSSLYFEHIGNEDYTLGEPILELKTDDYMEGSTSYGFFFGYDDVIEQKCFCLSTPLGVHKYPIHNLMRVNDLSREINNDYRLKKHQVQFAALRPDVGVEDLYNEFEGQTFYLEGNSGIDITKNELYVELEVAYSVLQGRNVDIVVPLEAFIDDIHPYHLYAGDSYYGKAVYDRRSDYLSLVDTVLNKVVTFHEQLIEFCRQQTLLGYVSHGVIGFRTLATVPKTIASDNSYLIRILDMTAFRKMTGFVELVYGKYVDKGLYISPVAGELVFTHEGVTYHDNGYARYAALVASTFETTTNMTVGDDVELRYDLSNRVRSDLARLGIVTFRRSVRKGIVVHSGVTAASETTDFHQLVNFRMVQVTISLLNSVIDNIRSQNYIGGMLQNVIETTCASTLLDLKNLGVLTDYSVSFRWLSDGSKGEVIIYFKSKDMIEGVHLTAALGENESGGLLNDSI